MIGIDLGKMDRFFEEIIQHKFDIAFCNEKCVVQSKCQSIACNKYILLCKLKQSPENSFNQQFRTK